MLLTSLTYFFIGVHHWRKGASAWAVILDTALSAALALPVHLTALAVVEVGAFDPRGTRSGLLHLYYDLAVFAHKPYAVMSSALQPISDRPQQLRTLL